MPIPAFRRLLPIDLAARAFRLAGLTLLLVEPASALRLSGRAFDAAGEIEVRDVPDAEAQAAIEAAFLEFDQSALDLRALEAAAATGKPVALDPRAKILVERAFGFCYWSDGGVGPLGGELYRLLGLRTPVAALPTPDALQAAADSAGCARASYDEKASSLTVAPGSRADFFPFELGWAVDRAVELLKSRGMKNLEVVLGPVRRGIGPGPAGLGWRVEPPTVPGLEEPLSGFYLRDHALAVITPADRTLTIAGDRIVAYVDQRSGRSVGGVAQVMVVSELATDANALAYAMFAMGPRSGMMRAGNLTPRPSIRWLLGTGEGPPVITDHNWSAVPRR